jgi:hypothetical protein
MSPGPNSYESGYQTVVAEIVRFPTSDMDRPNTSEPLSKIVS